MLCAAESNYGVVVGPHVTHTQTQIRHFANIFLMHTALTNARSMSDVVSFRQCGGGRMVVDGVLFTTRIRVVGVVIECI